MGLDGASSEPVFQEPDFDQKVTVGMFQEYKRKINEKGRLSPDELSHFQSIRMQLGLSIKKVVGNKTLDGTVTSTL